jgi:hypothetical protein
MDMGIHQTRHHRAAAEINDLGARIGALANILVGPDCENSSIADRDGLKEEVSSSVMTFPLIRTISAVGA